MDRRRALVLAACLLVVSGLRWVVNSHAWSGPVVLRVSQAHGVHLHDWVAVACFGWAAWCLRLAAGAGRVTVEPVRPLPVPVAAAAPRPVLAERPARPARPVVVAGPATLAEFLGQPEPELVPLEADRVASGPAVEGERGA